MRTTKQLSRRIIVTSVVSMAICNAVYAVMIPFVMNFGAEEFSAFLIKMVVATVLILPLALLVVYRLYKPIDKVLRTMDGGKVPSAHDALKARSAFVNIPRFLFIVGAVSYLLGLVLNFATDFFKGLPIATDQLVSRLFTALTWGVLNGIVTFRVINIFLVDAKLRMGIFELGSPAKGERRETTRGKLFLSGIVFFVYIISYAGVIYYNHTGSALRQAQDSYHALIQQTAGQAMDTDTAAARLAEIDQAIANRMQGGFITVLGILGAILLMVGLLYFVIVLEFQTHIDTLKGQLGKFSQGEFDLTQRINIISFDDVGEMADGMNRLIAHLSQTFVGIRDNTAVVFKSSHTTEATVARSKAEADGLARLMEEVDKNTRRQIEVIDAAVTRFNALAERIEGLVSSITRQTLTVEQTGGTTKAMLASFEAVLRSAIESEALFQELVRSIDGGNAEVRLSLESTNEINQASSQVSAMVKLIQDIAERSNILAMNAAIEASHAGQYGLGFAVVAQEVRKLAENTSTSTREIEALVSQLQAKNARGIQISENLTRVFRTLYEGMERTAQKMSGISQASRQQSVAAAGNLDDIDRLLVITQSLSRDAMVLKDENKNIGAAVKLLTETSGALASYNEKLLSGIRAIATDFERLNSTFAESSKGISALEEKVSGFKMESSTVV